MERWLLAISRTLPASKHRVHNQVTITIKLPNTPQPTFTLLSPNIPTITMPTSHIFTHLNGVDAGIVIAALHNHELMIKTLCPALVSFSFDSGDKNTQATYSIIDRKPIGQVRPFPHPLFSSPALSTHQLPNRDADTSSDNIQTHPHQRDLRRRFSRQRQTARRRSHDFGEMARQGWAACGGGGD